MTARAHAYMKPNDRLSAAERLQIYNWQYSYRLLDSLAEDFPALLGKQTFAKLSVAYRSDCPSRSFTLRDLGARLYDWPVGHPGRHARSTISLSTDSNGLTWRLRRPGVPRDRARRPGASGSEDARCPAALRQAAQTVIPVDKLRPSIDEGWSGGRIPAGRLPEAGEIPFLLAVHRMCRVAVSTLGSLPCCNAFRAVGLSTEFFAARFAPRRCPSPNFRSNFRNGLPGG